MGNARCHHAFEIVILAHHEEEWYVMPLDTRSDYILSGLTVHDRKQLARHYTPVTTVDKLWYVVEAAWAAIDEHAIHSPYGSMARRITAVIAAGEVCSRY